LVFAHGCIAEMAGRAGLLEDWQDVAVEGGFGLAGGSEMGEEKETGGGPEGAGQEAMGWHGVCVEFIEKREKLGVKRAFIPAY
jgi:hypothetical protein